ncbi:uncharacterized protein AMSG_09903 [Thecamonas trahens ATCC 50062]|uniref:Uncharacterized protein n=1 Tax=Thecamonas trahens ATCC 50062 TaxID=461836 RepID=A0A0L0DQ40_THETB|nr:hypothetical protein AMSG_09903 [Thecamonas trahens ATCC 50062]KNC54126.1 hypothetical protein AMSG_09903 [Thecamonas trahens ATCC 50062]|eukprot:XP_013753948.1 hypothetical protein AMSG_09903 [Thecamonas trahens ATCC 50062]
MALITYLGTRTAAVAGLVGLVMGTQMPPQATDVRLVALRLVLAACECTCPPSRACACPDQLRVALSTNEVLDELIGWLVDEAAHIDGGADRADEGGGAAEAVIRDPLPGLVMVVDVLLRTKTRRVLSYIRARGERWFAGLFAYMERKPVVAQSLLEAVIHVAESGRAEGRRACVSFLEWLSSLSLLDIMIEELEHLNLWSSLVMVMDDATLGLDDGVEGKSSEPPAGAYVAAITVSDTAVDATALAAARRDGIDGIAYGRRGATAAAVRRKPPSPLLTPLRSPTVASRLIAHVVAGLAECSSADVPDYEAAARVENMLAMATHLVELVGRVARLDAADSSGAAADMAIPPVVAEIQDVLPELGNAIRAPLGREPPVMRTTEYKALAFVLAVTRLGLRVINTGVLYSAVPEAALDLVLALPLANCVHTLALELLLQLAQLPGAVTYLRDGLGFGDRVAAVVIRDAERVGVSMAERSANIAFLIHIMTLLELDLLDEPSSLVQEALVIRSLSHSFGTSFELPVHLRAVPHLANIADLAHEPLLPVFADLAKLAKFGILAN